jgi:hypothetical protein
VESDIGPEDTARLFQRFRWGQYTPAGSIERAGFFARQLGRNGSSDGWVWGWAAVCLVAPFIAGIALVVYAVTRVLG